MGLIVLSGFGASGATLRSRCELVADDAPPFEVLGHDSKEFALNLASAKDLFTEAADRLSVRGFDWSPAPRTLRPSDDFLELVEQGRQAEVE